jgi:hypothetical protein
MERWMPILIERHRCRAVIGKGGLLEGTTEACKKYGCVYLSVVGGAASYYDARAKIINVFWPDLDSQAILECDIKDYGPMFVGIDAHGNNHYLNLRQKAIDKRQDIYEMLQIKELPWAPQYESFPGSRGFSMRTFAPRGVFYEKPRVAVYLELDPQGNRRRTGRLPAFACVYVVESCRTGGI